VKLEHGAQDSEASQASGAQTALDVTPKLPVSEPANKQRHNTDALAPAELTGRALLTGVVLGAALAAANVYTALKTGYIDGGSITASVLGFAAFRALARPYSALENNITQTVAASAAVMSFVAGVAGPTAALARAGTPLSSGALIAWTLSLATLGIGIGAALRSRLIAAEGLPFPTGTATAEVITAMNQAGEHGLRRARGLLLAAAVAAGVGWLRDRVEVLPQMLELPLTIAGLSASELSLGVSVSPLMFATGLLSGLRVGVSMLLGGVLAWLVVLPRLIAAGIVQGADHGAASGWLLWPAVALVLSSSLTSLAGDWRVLGSGVRDVYRLLARRAPPTAAGPVAMSGNRKHTRALLLLCAISALTVLWVAHAELGLGVGRVLLALLLSAALAVVCARGAGETDIAPAGDMGGLTQLVFGSPVHRTSSLACGGIATAEATQTAQTLWAFKAGHKLGANPQLQIVAQLVGAVVGGLVVVPTFQVVASAYGIGTERLPAISVLSWEATAAAVQGGLGSLPPYAAMSAAAAFSLGVALTLAGKTRAARYLPSPVALGIGVLMPLSMTSTLFVGALCLTWIAARWPDWTRDHIESVAGGAIAGESLLAVFLAALIALGVLH
jgi:uncharacterized oligopeptide transporter (OPT) family protein